MIQHEIQVLYDATNLYPSLPIDKAIDVILQQLREDYGDLKIKTKLTQIMVVVSESYLQNLEKHAIESAWTVPRIRE